MREKILEFNAKATDFNTIWYMYTHVYFRGVIPWGGGVLWGKKDRDDRRKFQKTTLKNAKP